MSDYTTLLAPGTRGRNHGEQFPRAFREGTFTILECTQHYRDGTHEYRVRYDDGREILLNYVHAVDVSDDILEKQ